MKIRKEEMGWRIVHSGGDLMSPEGSPFRTRRKSPAGDDVGGPGMVIAERAGRKEENLK